MPPDTTDAVDHGATADSSHSPTPAGTQLILSRHSTRAFLPSQPVPVSLLHECLSLAQNAPSSTNHQPWRLYFMSGKRLGRARVALTNAVQSGMASTTPDTPSQFDRFRSELGHELYGEHGYNIARGDKQGMQQARMRNYEFFDAPTVAAVCIPSALVAKGFLAETLSVGLYLQTLVLLMAERGLGSCMQVAPAGYGDVLQKIMGIQTEEVEIICTLAVGYEDPSERINSVRARREQWKENVTFLNSD